LLVVGPFPGILVYFLKHFIQALDHVFVNDFVLLDARVVFVVFGVALDLVLNQPVYLNARFVVCYDDAYQREAV
jgi:hypothetical protein